MKALSESKLVQKKRQRFAWVTLARKMVSFLAILVALWIITPLSTEFQSSTSAAFVQGVTEYSRSSFSGVASGQDWWLWMDRHLLWLPPAATVGSTCVCVCVCVWCVSCVCVYAYLPS